MQFFLLNLSSFNWWLRKGEICSLLRFLNREKYFTFRKGDTAYTVQRGSSNQFGRYLSVIELKVGGHRRTIVIPAGKATKLEGVWD